MSGPKIVALGEVLWDLLPAGPMLGGAPANFAFHAQALGAQSSLISRVGADELGDRIVQRFSAEGLSTRGLQRDSQAPTGTVSVELSADGQPTYTIHAPVAWDGIVADLAAGEFVADAEVVCFGSLAQRSAVSRASIRALLAAAPPRAWRIFDINLRQDYYSAEVIETSLNLANVLKLNDTELPVLAAQFGLAGTPREQVAALAARFDLHAVALTLGARGSLLWLDGAFDEYPGVATTVRDTVGAGDAFTAVLSLGLLGGWSPAQISTRANAVAAFVCSVSGATPPLPPALTVGIT